MLGAAFGVGFVLGPAIGGLAALGGPHVPFYVAGVLATVNAVAALIRLPETRAAHERPTHPAVHVPRSPVLRRLALIGFLTTFSFAAFEATFSLFGKRRFDLTESGVSVVFLLIGVVLVVMQGGVYHRLVRRHDVARVYLGGVVAHLARPGADRRGDGVADARRRARPARHRAGRGQPGDHHARRRPRAGAPPWRGDGLPAVGVRGGAHHRPGDRRRAVRPGDLEPVRRRRACCAPWWRVLLVGWRITGGAPVGGRTVPEPQSV